jgi:hypothetical protein
MAVKGTIDAGTKLIGTGSSIIGTLAKPAVQIAIGAPVALGITLAVLKHSAQREKPVDAKLTQNNLLIAEYERAMAEAERMRALDIDNQERNLARKDIGKTTRELHI